MEFTNTTNFTSYIKKITNSKTMTTPSYYCYKMFEMSYIIHTLYEMK